MKQDQIVQRLRASKAAFENMTTIQGLADGRMWAEQHAEYADLQAVSNLRLVGHSYALQFDRAIGNSGSWGDSFWNDDERDEYPRDEYVESFVEGCGDVWDEVRDKL